MACARARVNMSLGARSFHALTSVRSKALGDEVSGASNGAPRSLGADPRTFLRFGARPASPAFHISGLSSSSSESTPATRSARTARSRPGQSMASGHDP